MTNEEASKILDDYDINFDGHTAEVIAEAFDVAFRALEQKDWKFYYDHGYAQAKRDLQEPKAGHWGRKTKVDAYDIAGVKSWGIKCQCDRCGFTTIVVEDFGYYKYCPNCGAKMESEDKV